MNMLNGSCREQQPIKYKETYSFGLATTKFSFSYSALLKEGRLLGCVIWRQFVDI
jgi:hypothetical protein